MLAVEYEKKFGFFQLSEFSSTAKMVVNDSEKIYANKACLRLLKIENSSEIGKQQLQSFIHPHFYNLSQKLLVQILKENSTLEQTELKLIDRHNQTIDVELTIGPFYFEKELFAQIIIQDLTEKKETQKMLMQTDKLSVMGELATGIVHEIRNPLTILKGFLELLAPETSNKGREYISIMTTELLRIEAIANDLLYFSKPHKMNKKWINIVPLVKEVIYLFESLAFKRTVSINFFCDNEYIAIECDEVQIKQALINFIKNAIEATSNNGEVTIKMEKDCNHNIAKIFVSDTGCGMTNDEIQKLGTSFFTTKEDGTGLGIIVTYTIIKNHHGTIEVKSDKGQGTTFTISLPFSSQ